MNIFDNDLYKFTMWNLVSQLYPNVKVSYKAQDRKNQIVSTFDKMDQTRFLAEHPFDNFYIISHCDFEDKDFEFSKNEFIKRFPQLTNLSSFKRNSLTSKLWKDNILYEIPFLYWFSERYYKQVCNYRFLTVSSAIQITVEKLHRMDDIGKFYNRKVIFSELGTRRRISHEYQDAVLTTIKEETEDPELYPNIQFKGTSNVHFGLKYNLPIVGTMAHEWIMAHSVLSSFQNANQAALSTWQSFYPNDFKVALTDTYSTNNFFRTFDNPLKDHFKTLRHDSGDPIAFIDKVVNFYSKSELENITILFSDSVNDGVIERIFYYLKKNDININVEFGIGTWLTAKPYDNFETLNIVVKLDTVNGVPVCKLSDEPGKESGEKNIVELTKSILRLFGDIK